MDFSVANATKGNEVFFHVVSQPASWLHVMDLEVLGTTASLTSPAVTLEHLLAKSMIRNPV
jgi:hypothetical protein